jgi:hypothetical protein
MAIYLARRILVAPSVSSSLATHLFHEESLKNKKALVNHSNQFVHTASFSFEFVEKFLQSFNPLNGDKPHHERRGNKGQHSPHQATG